MMIMININNFIQEKLKINSKSKISQYTYQPKDRDELKELIDKLIEKRGNNADLNDINTSEITDMYDLFTFSNSRFNGDISEWDVSNVKDMSQMFMGSDFTGKNGDISNWDVSNVEDMSCMFQHSKFNGDISKWDVSNVENMNNMFQDSKFTMKNGDISNWNIHKLKDMSWMFANSPLEKNPPKWYHE